jgi:hypothetical protein
VEVRAALSKVEAGDNARSLAVRAGVWGGFRRGW